MKHLNKGLIADQLTEADEELHRIREVLLSGKSVHPEELQVMFEHLYHHINFAWNARFVTYDQYRKHTERDFNTWSKMPTDIIEFEIGNK